MSQTYSSAPLIFSDAEWKHVTVTIDSIEKKIVFFENGQQVGSSNLVNGFIPNISGINIGAKSNVANRITEHFNGELDNVMIHNRILDLDEIKMLSESKFSSIQNANTWVHVGASYDLATSNVSIYKNGAKVGETIIPTIITLPTNTNEMKIGSNLKGLMDNFSMYERKLSDDEFKILGNIKRYEGEFYNSKTIVNCKFNEVISISKNLRAKYFLFEYLENYSGTLSTLANATLANVTLYDGDVTYTPIITPSSEPNTEFIEIVDVHNISKMVLTNADDPDAIKRVAIYYAETLPGGKATVGDVTVDEFKANSIFAQVFHLNKNADNKITDNIAVDVSGNGNHGFFSADPVLNPVNHYGGTYNKSVEIGQTGIIQLATTTVPVTVAANANGANIYQFNGNYSPSKKFGLGKNTYTFTGSVLASHPIAFVFEPASAATVSSSSVSTNATINGVEVPHYSGDVTVVINSEFTVGSYHCLHHGYMGGMANLVFSTLSEDTTNASDIIFNGGAFSNLDFSESYLSAWINVPETLSNDVCIFKKDDNFAFKCDKTTNVLSVEYLVLGGSTSNVVTSTLALANNTWTNVGVHFNRQNEKVTFFKKTAASALADSEVKSNLILNFNNSINTDLRCFMDETVAANQIVLVDNLRVELGHFDGINKFYEFADSNNEIELLRVPANTWTHVAATYESAKGRVKMYHDGKQIGEFNNYNVAPTDDINQKVYIGKHNTNVITTGTLLSDITVYDRVFTDNQVNDLYESQEYPAVIPDSGSESPYA
jgi:hypothetical protein